MHAPRPHVDSLPERPCRSARFLSLPLPCTGTCPTASLTCVPMTGCWTCRWPTGWMVSLWEAQQVRGPAAGASTRQQRALAARHACCGLEGSSGSSSSPAAATAAAAGLALCARVGVVCCVPQAAVSSSAEHSNFAAGLCVCTHCAGEGHLMSWDEHIMLIAHTVNVYGDRLKVGCCCRCCRCGAVHVCSSCVLVVGRQYMCAGDLRPRAGCDADSDTKGSATTASTLCWHAH